MSKYDRAITVFSPDGQLLQVEYAQEAVLRGSPVIGVRGYNVVVLATEKRIVERLQDERTEGKIVELDEHVALAFSGLRADARILITRGQIECQSHRLIVEDAASIEHVARYLAGLKQGCTQSNGRRPYGVSCLVAGFDYDGGPHLFQTEPAGTFYEWKVDNALATLRMLRVSMGDGIAYHQVNRLLVWTDFAFHQNIWDHVACAIGRGEKTARESLEKEYNELLVCTQEGAVKLALTSLMEVVHCGQRNLDVVVLKKFEPMLWLKPEQIIPVIEEIEKNKEKHP